MSSHAVKVTYAVDLAVKELVRTSPQPIFATFTFQENITDMNEAKRRWHRLRERIKRLYPRIRGVGVWQRQQRGAWHFHCVFDRPIPVEWLRPAALECGFGTFVNLQRLKAVNGYRPPDLKRIIGYITRYLAKDLGGDNDAWVRTVTYIGNGRVASCRFGWARGMGKLYRLGRSIYFELFQTLPRFDSYWLIVRIGWDLLSEMEQDAMLSRGGPVRKWWYGDHDPDPF